MYLSLFTFKIQQYKIILLLMNSKSDIQIIGKQPATIEMPIGYQQNKTNILILMSIMIPIIYFDFIQIYRTQVLNKFSLFLIGNIFNMVLFACWIKDFRSASNYIDTKTPVFIKRVINCCNNMILIIIELLVVLIFSLKYSPKAFKISKGWIYFDACVILLIYSVKQLRQFSDRIEKQIFWSYKIQQIQKVQNDKSESSKTFRTIFILCLVEWSHESNGLQSKPIFLIEVFGVVIILILLGSIYKSYDYLVQLKLKIKKVRQIILILIKFALLLSIYNIYFCYYIVKIRWYQMVLELTAFYHIALVVLVPYFYQQIAYVFSKRNYKKGRIIKRVSQNWFTQDKNYMMDPNLPYKWTEENCTACYERQVNAVFMPCGHFVLCSSCYFISILNGLVNCSFCNKQISSAMTIDVSRIEKEHPKFEFGLQKMMYEWEYRVK